MFNVVIGVLELVSSLVICEIFLLVNKGLLFCMLMIMVLFLSWSCLIILVKCFVFDWWFLCVIRILFVNLLIVLNIVWWLVVI